MVLRLRVGKYSSDITYLTVVAPDKPLAELQKHQNLISYYQVMA